MEGSFDREKHVAFFSHAYRSTWKNHSADPMKMTVLYFIISALDILGVLSAVVDKSAVIEWIYAQQVDTEDGSGRVYTEWWMNAGFRVGPCLGTKGASDGKFDYGTLASTYCALAMLTILGDDLHRVHKSAITKALPYMQKPNGCFVSHPDGIECDVRFLFCACAISAFLKDWSGVDKEKAVCYIVNSQGYEGGISMTPLQEAHAGSTYCAVNSMHLMGEMHRLPHQLRLYDWLLERQGTGFQGRVNKPLDTCYGFWVGATAQTLGNMHCRSHRLFRPKRQCGVFVRPAGTEGWVREIFT